MADEKPQEKAPPARFEFTDAANKKHEFFMSYALLNRLTHLCPDIEKLLGIVAFPDLQDDITECLLAPRDEKGKPQMDQFELERDTKDITPEQMQDLIMWAVGHMSHFFTGLMNKNLEHADKTQKTIEMIKTRAETLTDSKSGLTASVSSTPSAGPSE